MGKRKRNPFSNAFRGVIAAYCSERNLRIHTAIALVVVVLGIWLDLTRGEWYWITLCIALVIIAELFNTAIEAGVDLVSPDDHPLAGKAKDVAAGAVLVAAVFAVIVGGGIFLPKLWIVVIG